MYPAFTIAIWYIPRAENNNFTLVARTPKLLLDRRRCAARRQHSQYDGYNGQRRNVAEQVAVLCGSVERLRSHDARMHQARPNSEPDQAAILQRISRSEEQEYSQRRVHSENHLLVFRLIGLPAPAGRPPSHHQRINAQNKNQPNENQSYTQITQPRGIAHKSPLPDFSWRDYRSERDARPCVAACQLVVIYKSNPRGVREPSRRWASA